ncbi:acyl carrier protein [Nocardiopsis sp. EMB25]|uniref:acyl carrier protein n=1 Tax=Nocardiopsis sp. EMB25 TaxID=2835867 RepID=UPI0022852804|nr:acyl carrier protein [Nocardiopsis sp. EMB25]MCY9783903.1 acyl carrier protein [Nocardiopsis sp. EMB25]
MRSEELVTEVVADLLDVDEDGLTPDLALADVEGWDSVNALRVLVYLERELGTELDYDAFERARTLRDMAAVLDAHAPAGDGADR